MGPLLLHTAHHDINLVYFKFRYRSAVGSRVFADYSVSSTQTMSHRSNLLATKAITVDFLLQQPAIVSSNNTPLSSATTKRRPIPSYQRFRLFLFVTCTNSDVSVFEHLAGEIQLCKVQ